MNILVTGGAGYIGSHTVELLLSQGHEVHVIDSLCNHSQFYINRELIFPVSTGEVDAVSWMLKSKQIDVVIHLAAFLSVEESVREPVKYYQNNVANSINLLYAMEQTGVNKIVFSSTCAVYGNVSDTYVDSNTPVNPISPYAKSKYLFENFLKESSFKSVVLRYFNVMGASKSGKVGEPYDSNCSKILGSLFRVVSGKEKVFKIYGNDYNTIDGTCVRDYIHVSDIADAHIKAAEYLVNHNDSATINLGSYRPYSVEQIVQKTREVTGHPIPVVYEPRRNGDVEKICAKQEDNVLNWMPVYSDLDTMIGSAWNWYKTLA